MGPPPPWQGMVCINSVFASYITSLAVPYVLNAYLEYDCYSYPLRDLKYMSLVISKIACCF